MTPSQIEQAAALLANARRDGARIAPLPEACRPATVAEAHAIQDAVAARMGARITAFKASASGTRGTIHDVHATPARLAAATVPQCGVEAEVAFVFREDVPPGPHTPQAVAAAIDAFAAIEIVSNRFADTDHTPRMDMLADCMGNGGLIAGFRVTDWRRLDLSTIPVTLTVNGETVVSQNGGHPLGDPLASVVALIEVNGGAKAGQIITCGSYTGLRYLQPGDTCIARFDGLGEAAVTFTV